MNIVVCIKEVSDPEAPTEDFRIDSDRKIVVPSRNVARVLNPFDEQAIEAALQIKDTEGGRVTILSLGNKMDRVVVKKALHMGADELILLEDEAFTGGDSWSTTHALALAIKKIGYCDLILCGRQAADWNAGQAGLGIAEILGLPSVTVARKIEVINGKARVERVTDDGYEVIEVSLPALITLSNELGEPRYPSIEGIRKSDKIQPTIWKPEDIGADPSEVGFKGRRLKLLKLFQPVREGKCEIIEGETLEEAAENLALRLRNEKII